MPVRLNTNESPEPPPPAWRDELARATASIAWHRYPDRGAGDLRAAIAGLHCVDPANVFVANGSNEVIQTLLLTYAGAGRRVATFEPTYQLHAHLARISGATVVEGERGADFTLDATRACELLERTEPMVTFLCSPNNPTGREEPRSTVEAIAEAAPGVLVVDEAYAEFASWSALDMVAEDRPLVVTRTFSKTWSMAAARLGYLVGPTWLVSELDKVVLPYHLDVAKQIAGRLAVGYVDEMRLRVAKIVAQREVLAAGMGALDVDVFPSGANFILFRPRAMSGHDLWQGLLERGVLVRDCSGWPRLENCLRVTVGTAGENDVFLTAMEELLR